MKVVGRPRGDVIGDGTESDSSRRVVVDRLRGAITARTTEIVACLGECELLVETPRPVVVVTRPVRPWPAAGR